MIFISYAAIALAGAGLHLWRRPEPRLPGRAAEISLLWWLVVTIGLSGVIAGLLHVFDGPSMAQEIGFTRGDGGFQTEVGFGDLALGVAALLCIWFRDRYWLAILIVASISLWGDGYGHIHQMVVNDNHAPDNTGAVLYADFLFPLVGWALYGVLERARRAATAAPGV